jgi:hypothetical protein
MLQNAASRMDEGEFAANCNNCRDCYAPHMTFELPCATLDDPNRDHHFLAAEEMVAKLREANMAGRGYASADLFQAYRDWAAKRGLDPVHINAWTHAMRRAGMKPFMRLNTRMWMLPG